MNDFTINVKLDLEQDARNYRAAFNQNKHAANWQKQLETILDFDFKQLVGVPEEQAYPIMKAYLENVRKDKDHIVEKKIQEILQKLNLIKNNIFFQMEKITKHPIYRDDFTILLTSLNR